MTLASVCSHKAMFASNGSEMIALTLRYEPNELPVLVLSTYVTIIHEQVSRGLKFCSLWLGCAVCTLASKE